MALKQSWVVVLSEIKPFKNIRQATIYPLPENIPFIRKGN